MLSVHSGSAKRLSARALPSGDGASSPAIRRTVRFQIER